MTGIAGVWRRVDGTSAESEVVRMLSTMSHRGGDGESIVSLDDFALGVTRRNVTPESFGETQPFRSGEITIAFDGRLDNREELLRDHGCQREDSDAALVVRVFSERGATAFGRLIGDFAFALFDRRGDELFLVRDALGSRPLHYTTQDPAVRFSSEVKALLATGAVPRRVNRPKVEALLANGELGEPTETFFEGISSVPMSHYVRCDRERLQIVRYWDFDTSTTVRFARPGDYVERMRELLFQSVARRMRSRFPVAASLSGGLDSSSIFCIADRLRRDDSTHPEMIGVSYVSAAGTEAGEQEYLDLLEEQSTSKVIRFDLGLPTITKEARDQINYAEVPELHWDAYNEMFRRSAATGARTTLSGYRGDQMLGPGGYLVDLALRLRWRTLSRHIREQARWTNTGNASVFVRWVLRASLRSAAPERLREAVRRVRRVRGRSQRLPRDLFAGKSFWSNHAEDLYRHLRSSYFAAQTERDSKLASRFGLEASYPFVDRDLAQFLISIPGEVVNRGGINRALQREALAGVLPEAIRLRPTKADFTSAAIEGIIRELPSIRGALGPGSRVRSMGFQVEEGGGLDIAGDRGENAARTRKFYTLFALEVWLGQFFGAE